MKNITESTLVVLAAIYKPEALFLTEAYVLKPRKYKFVFVFPEYGLTQEPLTHVSGIQMYLALFQGFYATVSIAIKDGHISDEMLISSTDAFAATIVRQSVEFTQMLKPGQSAEIEFSLSMYGKLWIGRKHNFFRVKYKGFVKGEAEAVSPLAA